MWILLHTSYFIYYDSHYSLRIPPFTKWGVLRAMSSLARLRIVAFNDVYEISNLPRVQTFLSKLSPAPTAVVLAGDFLSPSILSSIDGGRGMVATLRNIGLSHASLGNHEQVSTKLIMRSLYL
jgi:2',3'-cyclic-nucleotide 2'-phosphodiesterase (5'-nucleotidase family)